MSTVWIYYFSNFLSNHVVYLVYGGDPPCQILGFADIWCNKPQPRSLTQLSPMTNSNFYSDTKYCTRCAEYVRYLQSVHESYCAECGAKVKLFSSADRKSFLRSLKNKNNKKPDGNQKRVS